MTDRCSTPNCDEIDGLSLLEGAEGKVCAACAAEVRLLVATLREREIERDRQIASRRIEE